MLRLMFVIALALLALWLVGPDRADAQWSPPFDVAAQDGAERPEIAVGPSGAAIVVWEGDGGATVVVRARRIDATGALGPIQDVSDPAGFGYTPHVALDASGNATVAWSASAGGVDMVRARRIAPDGTRGPITDLSAAGERAAEPRVAVDAAGAATVIWHRSDDPGYTIQGRRMDAGGALGPIEDLAADAFPGGYQVAAGPHADAYAAWSAGGVIQARPIRAGGLGPAVDLSATGLGASRPQLAVDPAGALTAAWQLGDGSVQARRGDAGGGLGPILDLAPPQADGVALAVGADGEATVAWSRWNGANSRIELRRITPGGALTDTRELSTDAGDDEGPRLVVDGAGVATALWIHRDLAGDALVRARAAAPDGTLGPAVDVSPTQADLVTPGLGGDAAGGAVAVWGHFDARHALGAARSTAPAAPTGPPPASAAAAPLPLAPARCAAVALRTLRSHTRGQPGRRSRRVEGVGARLVLSGPARLHVVAATLGYRHRGRARTARLGAGRLTTGKRPRLRLALPRRVAARLPLGRTARLALRLRARATGAGCAYGKTKTLRVATRVIWVAPRSAI